MTFPKWLVVLAALYAIPVLMTVVLYIITDWKMPTPWRYHVDHVLGALAIDAACIVVHATTGWRGRFPWALGGVVFGLRELWQFQDKGYFDAPGFWWPVGASVALAVVLRFAIRR